MERIPQMVSVSDLKNRHLEVLAKVARGPVLLATRNRPTAVLLSPEMWEGLMDRIEDLEDLITALQVELDLSRGDSAVEPADIAELEAMARRENVPT
jgi:prevent-host-death family protein